MAGSVGIAGQRENHLIGGFTMATSAASPTESQSAVALPGETIGADAASPVQAPEKSQLPTEGLPAELIAGVPAESPATSKKNAVSRIKELNWRNKNLQQQNDALRAENFALKESATELRRQADESESLRAQIAALEKREVEWQCLAIETADSQAQAEKQKQIDAEQRRFEAWKLLIAKSRALAATSNFDEAMAKSDRFFSTALLEQLLQFAIGPAIAHRLALNPKLCQQLSQCTLAASALALVRIEAEIQQEIVKKNAEQAFLKANGGW
jgi:hypothetical protein